MRSAGLRNPLPRAWPSASAHIAHSMQPTTRGLGPTTATIPIASCDPAANSERAAAAVPANSLPVNESECRPQSINLMHVDFEGYRRRAQQLRREEINRLLTSAIAGVVAVCRLLRRWVVRRLIRSAQRDEGR